MLRFLTAGESHGPNLTVIVEGMPAGWPIDIAAINAQLARRQGGYGRGARMKIEKDEARVTSGIRWGETLGSPITLVVENKDWKNWSKKMSVDPADRDDSIAVTRPRPMCESSWRSASISRVTRSRKSSGVVGFLTFTTCAGRADETSSSPDASAGCRTGFR